MWSEGAEDGEREKRKDEQFSLVSYSLAFLFFGSE
jgi:hypothetical protein